MNYKLGRIKKRFELLKSSKEKGLITFVTAGDPDYNTSLTIIKSLPDAGADLIEIGMPFTDPMADGVGIQASYLRSLNSGQTLSKTLNIVNDFRKKDYTTPVILMGYFNPIYKYGINNFIRESKKVGVDGLIVVDLPPEADEELCKPARREGLDFIRLATPTTDKKRLSLLLKNSSGFLYYISVVGITGTKTPDLHDIELATNNIREKTNLPIAVGFGIRSPDQAVNIAKYSDAVVVGSAIVDKIGEMSSLSGDYKKKSIEQSLSFVQDLSKAIKKKDNYKL